MRTAPARLVAIGTAQASWAVHYDIPVAVVAAPRRLTASSSRRGPGLALVGRLVRRRQIRDLATGELDLTGAGRCLTARSAADRRGPAAPRGDRRGRR